MLTVVIPVKDYSSVQTQLAQAAEQGAAGVELRLDYAPHLDFSAIQALQAYSDLPLIFTLRSVAQGGHYRGTEEQRLKDLLALAALNPDYLDVEYTLPGSFIAELRAQSRHVKLIRSYHHFQKTPSDLQAILKEMIHPEITIYKIATHATRTSDALRMLSFVKSQASFLSLAGMCMGEYGQVTRILGPVVGSALTFACLSAEEVTAPGQLTLHELLTIYRFDSLNRATRVYALLGDPVSASVGHWVHNKVMGFLATNAVYVKLRVSAEELSSLLEYARELAFDGLSVTMPFKETILSLLTGVDEHVAQIQAANTIVRQNDLYHGYNTDGKGAVQALAKVMDITQQLILIVGAGGSARAIAYEALRQGAKVIIVNRTASKAQALAHALGCEGYGFEALKTLKERHYTVLLNTLPNAAYAEPEMQSLFHLRDLPASLVVMDIVYRPRKTTFLSLVESIASNVILGEEMFIQQALGQIEHWFHPPVKLLEEIEAVVREKVEANA